jgi:hypothetical protein
VQAIDQKVKGWMVRAMDHSVIEGAMVAASDCKLSYKVLIL